MANTEKMTKREFLSAVLKTEGLSAERTEYANSEIAKLDKTNEKRRNTPSKTDLENLPIMNALFVKLTSEPQTASDLAPQVSISVQKASALLRKLVEQGDAVQLDVKIKGKGVQKVYKTVEPLAEEDEEEVEGDEYDEADDFELETDVDEIE